MRVVAQRVSRASVTVDGETLGEIRCGLLLLVSAGQDDTDRDLEWMANRVLNLRVFPDEKDRMNRSVLDVSGELLVISQFTLHGDCRKGHRPSFVRAMAPDAAKDFFDRFLKRLETSELSKVATGRFGANMQVSLINDGPVTLLIDSKKEF